MAKLQLAKSTPKLAAAFPFDVGLVEIVALGLRPDAIFTINIGLLIVYGDIPEMLETLLEPPCVEEMDEGEITEFEVTAVGVSVEVAKPLILRVTLTVAQSPWANSKVSVYYCELDN